MSIALYFARDYDRSIEMAERMLKIQPNNGWLYLSLFDNYWAKGRFQESIQEVEKAVSSFGFVENAARIDRALVSKGPQAAMKQYALECETVAAAKQAYMPVNTAAAYAFLGDKGRAMYWLEQAYEHHEQHWVTTDIPLEVISADPMFESLRSDPRFKDLLRRIDVPR